MNTGWVGGPFGVGTRMKLPYTRAMVNAAIEGKLNDVEFETDPAFGMTVPSPFREFLQSSCMRAMHGKIPRPMTRQPLTCRRALLKTLKSLTCRRM